MQLIVLVSLCSFGAAFHPSVFPQQRASALMMAKKKKKKKGSAGQGFGRAEQEVVETETYEEPFVGTSPGLQSLEGASDVVPTFAAMPEVELDPNMPVEERTKQLLREKYGLRTLEDQRRADKLNENKRRMAELKALADEEDFDIMRVIPAPILVAFDTFLKAGLAITTILFIAAGCGITAEAWSAASGSPLPEDIDNFIVNVVEPNFTPGLFVLLGFSITLGVFSALQLGSSTSQYKEDPFKK